MTRQQSDHLRSVLHLREGSWLVSPFFQESQDPQDTLAEVVRRASSTSIDGLKWQGIAYTTAGARAVREVSADARLFGTDSLVAAETEVPLCTVYELRLWAVLEKTSTGTGVLARELRWLNGSGATEVTVYADSASATAQRTEGTREPCWLRENTYLQHGADPSSADGAMTSIEVFVAEPEHSNTVFVDELMAGRWI